MTASTLAALQDAERAVRQATTAEAYDDALDRLRQVQERVRREARAAEAAPEFR